VENDIVFGLKKKRRKKNDFVVDNNNQQCTRSKSKTIASLSVITSAMLVWKPEGKKKSIKREIRLGGEKTPD